MKFRLLVLAVVGFGAVPAGAQDVPALERCATIGDEHARLSCYDALAASLRHAVVPAPHIAVAPQVQAAAPSPVAPVAAPVVAATPAAKVAEFGAETMRKAEPARDAPKDIEEIKATVTQVEFSKTNRFTITLDNGQVWRQIESDTSKARFRKNGEVVTISHGMLGSYNLALEGHEFVLFKVHRIR